LARMPTNHFMLPLLSWVAKVALNRRQPKHPPLRKTLSCHVSNFVILSAALSRPSDNALLGGRQAVVPFICLAVPFFGFWTKNPLLHRTICKIAFAFWNPRRYWLPADTLPESLIECGFQPVRYPQKPIESGMMA